MRRVLGRLPAAGRAEEALSEGAHQLPLSDVPRPADRGLQGRAAREDDEPVEARDRPDRLLPLSQVLHIVRHGPGAAAPRVGPSAARPAEENARPRRRRRQSLRAVPVLRQDHRER